MICFTKLTKSMIRLSVFFVLLLQVTSGKNFTKFPAILIFGDSTVDTGNNNYIATPFQANHYPYGKEFPGHIPTGRFSNGKLVVDFMGTLLGIKQTIPPFLQSGLSSYELCTGVSFASGGTGYDALTANIGGVVPMSKQIEYFKSYGARLNKIVGKEEAHRIIGGALVVVSAGTNDFLFNFYDIPTRSVLLDIDEYQEFILERLHDFVKELYNLGCRTFIIAGLPPMGCLPVQITANLDGTCAEEQNVDARIYNKRLAELLAHTQRSLQGSRIFYADIYTPIMDMIKSPKKYGFRKVTQGCCGTGLLEAGPLCTPLTPLCHNSSDYLFFDSIHPSEKAYHYILEFLEKQVISKL